MIYVITDNPEIQTKYATCNVRYALDKLEKESEIQVDTETQGFDPHTKDILCLQLGTKDGETQFVIDTLSVPISEFKELLENRVCVLQNAKFDLAFLYKYDIWPNVIRDTFLAECVLTTGLQDRTLGLDGLAFKYEDVVLDKSVRADIHKEGLSDRVIRYGADDVKYLSAIYEKQMQRIEQEQLGLALSLEEQYVQVLAYTELCGFLLDPVAWLKNTDKNEIALEQQRVSLNDMLMKYDIKEFIDAGGGLFPEDKIVDINWKSTKQVTELMNILGVDTKIRFKGVEKNSIEAKHLKKFKNVHPIIGEYLKFSELSKQVSTYGQKFLKHINSVTGRLHSNYWQILNTGRISSKEPNLQNITSDEAVRACFVPAEGNTLIVADYSQQETRVLADQASERNYIDFFLNGDGDSHSMVASRMFSQIKGEPVTVSKTENVELRQIGKVLSFQIAYGASAWSVKDSFGITEKKAQSFIDAYLESFPDLKAYFAKRKAEVLQNGYLVTDSVSKRRIYMSEFEEYKRLRQEISEIQEGGSSVPRDLTRSYYTLKGKFERTALNYPIQSISASMMKLAGVRMFQWIKENGLLNVVKIVSFIHDEMCLECPQHMAERVAEAAQIAMESSADVFCKQLPIPAKPNITDFWKK